MAFLLNALHLSLNKRLTDEPVEFLKDLIWGLFYFASFRRMFYPSVWICPFYRTALMRLVPECPIISCRWIITKTKVLVFSLALNSTFEPLSHSNSQLNNNKSSTALSLHILTIVMFCIQPSAGFLSLNLGLNIGFLLLETVFRLQTSEQWCSSVKIIWWTKPGRFCGGRQGDATEVS